MTVLSLWHRNSYTCIEMKCWAQIQHSGPWFNIKMSSYQYRKSHCGDKTILRPSYLHNGISYTAKTTSLYWIGTKMSLYQYTKSCCGDKTILRPSYLHNEISYTGKMTSGYWINLMDSYRSRTITWWWLSHSKKVNYEYYGSLMVSDHDMRP